MQRMNEIARGRGFRAAACQGHIFFSGKDLQLVDAGFRLSRLVDRHPHKASGDRSELFNIAFRIHRSTMREIVSRHELRQVRLQLADFPIDPCEFLLCLIAGGQLPVGVLDPREDRLHRVIIGLRNRIEFVVVTTGASQCQSHECGAGGVDHVGQFILSLHQAEFRILPFDQIVGPGDEKPGADVVANRVTGKLLDHEFVVGLIGIECVDHPITVVPRMGTLAVGLEPVRFTKANQVQPMHGQPFAIAWTGQDFFHQLFPGIGPLVVNERLHLLGIRRQTVHHQIQPANQSSAVGWTGHFQSAGSQFVFDEGVDRLIRIGRRHDWADHRL